MASRRGCMWCAAADLGSGAGPPAGSRRPCSESVARLWRPRPRGWRGPPAGCYATAVYLAGGCPAGPGWPGPHRPPSAASAQPLTYRQLYPGSWLTSFNRGRRGTPPAMRLHRRRLRARFQGARAQPPPLRPGQQHPLAHHPSVSDTVLRYLGTFKVPFFIINIYNYILRYY